MSKLSVDPDYSRRLIEASLDPLVTISRAGLITDVNTATETITGRARSELIGTDFSTYFTFPQDARKGYEQVFRDGQVVDYPLELAHVSGRVTPVLYNASVYRDEDGEVVGVFAAARDATDLVARQALADSERRYRLLAENSTDSVFLVDTTGSFTWVSPSTRQVLGYEPKDLLGANGASLIHPDDQAMLRSIRERVDLGQTTQEEMRHLTASGEYRWMLSVTNPALDENGAVVGRMVSVRDVHEQVLARRYLADSERRYRMLAENATDVVMQLDPDDVLVWASPSIEAELGWDPQHLVGTNVRELIHPDDRRSTLVWKARLVEGVDVPNLESRRLTAQGSYLWMSLRGRAIVRADGSLQGLIVGMRDIDAEVHARTALAHAIEHDPLTGLATLPVALSRIERLLSELVERSPSHAVGVLCVGVDGLMAVNEALTHAAGDRVLMAIATRIATVEDDPDLLARGSGDEFLVLLPDLVRAADAGVFAEQFRLAAHGAVTIGGNHLEPTVSIGIATGHRSANAEELLRDAALAMHRAKDDGRDRCEFFQSSLAREAQYRVNIENGIRDGLSGGQFVPWFQPVVDLGDESVVGFEALVRWVRPDGSIVPPDEFVPVAERTSLITDLDLVVLWRSVEILATMPALTYVAVNVSAATLASDGYADQVIGTLNRYGVEPERLHLEFTETALLYVSHQVRSVMHELAAIGVSWYVDDFGTGYSSISHLRDLPVAGLKLDLSFTAELGSADPTCEHLAKALAGLAEGLGLDTVAEGIETPQQAAILRAQGWKHGQGWLYGHAGPDLTPPALRSSANP
ncbi:MAG: EAL domain-containing protein [Actinomycetes bacterium]